ncbi:MAG: GNAT family N-acetyltransferase [Tepidisphaeraceae bacterium]
MELPDLTLRTCRFLRANWYGTRAGARIIGGAVVTVVPTNESPFPSHNLNSATFFGDEHGRPVPCDEVPSSISAIIREFEQAGVPRFFAHVYPPAMEETLEGELLRRGLKRFDSQRTTPSYVILTREMSASIGPVTSNFEVRPLPPREGDKDFVHILGAFDGDTCVARARLHAFDGVGLLCGAFTDERYHRQGAQSLLIEARLRLAKELGCDLAVSETLSILHSSLGNLKRAGFVPAFTKRVYRSEKSEVVIRASSGGRTSC